MVKITKITTQKNNIGRYNIFLDNGKGEKFGFGLDEDVLITSGITKGQEISEEALQSIMEKDAAHKCFTLALQYLSYRMRSKKEIKTYLLKKEQNPTHVEETLTRLEEQGYTDDASFAGAFVRTKVNTTSKGPHVIRKELQEKGITGAAAEQAMTYYTFEKELEKAVADLPVRSCKQKQRNLIKRKFSLHSSSCCRKAFQVQLLRKQCPWHSRISIRIQMQSLRLSVIREISFYANMRKKRRLSLIKKLRWHFIERASRWN